MSLNLTARKAGTIAAKSLALVNRYKVTTLSRQQIRCLSLTSPVIQNNYYKRQFKRKVHNDPPRLQYDAAPSSFPEKLVVESRIEEKSKIKSSSFADRFIVTAEVTVSKIFPAGFGWQSFSILASDYLGYAPDSLSFALTTGLGDATGVLAGHVAYHSMKKSFVDQDVNMEREKQTGLLLASAAFCSGTAWQPIVNLLQGADLSFMQELGGAWIGCGTAFYLGLRLSRTVLSGKFEHIKYPTYDNSRTDMSLSLAIGGATGFFVGTDGEFA